ncbi:endonuclease [Sporosarcina sp. BP05]|uniref:endonuclease n=1 Tax=Sporosarcina sp. BP05 TaxID=2758726 RepID=UPI00164445D6|nr:endonuclease [Sporosarcina sp. BP05]
MKNKGIVNHAFSKIILAFLLVVSMITPFISVTSASADTSLTVDEAIGQYVVGASKKISVEGYIVGFVVSETSVTGTATSNTNYAIASTPEETDLSKMLYVQLPVSPAYLRTDFGLQTNPTNVGKKVVMSGSLEKYFGNHAGLKSPTSMAFVNEEPIDPDPVDPNLVEAVTASPASSSVAKGTAITLSTKTAGATIYYTTDGTDPTIKSMSYTTPIIINETTTVKAIAMKEELENSEVSTFTYTVADTQTIAGARTEINKTVQIEGIVTTNPGLWGGGAFYMQDETAGMYIYAGSANVQPGDKIRVTGKVITYSNEVEIENPTIELISSGNVIPNAQVVEPSGVNEDTQGELVTINNVTISNLTFDSYGTFEFQAIAENGEKVLVRNDNRTGLVYADFIKVFKEGDKVNLTGIAAIFGTTFQLKTVGLESYDLVNKPAVYSSANEGTVPVDTKIELKSGLEGAEIYFTLDGSEPTQASTKYDAPILLPIGTTTIKAIAVTNKTTSKAFSFTYTIIKADGVIIREIQGKGHVSPYVGATVTDVTGVVTHLIDGTNFVMQDVENADKDNTTSEAIQVNKSANGVKVGAKVKVTGTVAENGSGANLSTTRITATQVTTYGTAELPAPLIVGVDIIPPNKIIDNDNLTSFDPAEDGIDFWESVEFMRLSFPNAKVVGPPYNGATPIVVESTTNNEFNLLGGLNIAADDYNPEKIFLTNTGSLDITSGDHFNGDVIGVISYTADGYRVLPETLPTLVKGNRTVEITHIEPTEDKLTVASYNVENFSMTTSDEKVTRIAKSFVTNMKNPDIITLVEVQDNDGETNSGTVDGSANYERLIAAITAAGGKTYKWTEVAPKNNDNGGAPGGNIRVGYLYNPERVSLVEGVHGTGSEGNTWDAQGNLALNPGVLDPSKFVNTRKPIAAQFDFKGEKVVVIGVHLNSKGGDQSLWGSSQPPFLGSEAQRLKLATTINAFIKDGLAKDPNLNIVLAGDMNDFEFTKTLDILKGNEMINMVDKAPANDRFSYFFQGNNQVLDHILVSKRLETKTKIDMIHINANYTEAQGRASDHEPVMVQIDFAGKDVIVPIIAEKIYNIKNLKTKKVTIGKPSVSVTIDDASVITEGIAFTGAYAEFHGAGFANTAVTIKPAESGAIIAFKGTKAKEVIIDGANVKEVRGAENIQEIKFINGANPDNIKFTNSKGEPIVVPSLPDGNNAPIVQKAIPNQTVKTGESISLVLTDYFSDPENDELTFMSTLGKIEGNSLTLTLSEGSHIVGVTASDGNKSVTTSFTVKVTADVESPTDVYYKDAIGKNGQALKNALHEIIDGHTELSYDQVWVALRETDEDPNNVNNVILFYSGDSRAKNRNGGNVGDWNREHTWAKSHGDFGTSKGPGTDIHHLRPTDVQVNSSRGNLDFDNGGSPVNGCKGCFKTANSFEPPDNVKGDVARILFYMATRYEKGDKVDLELNDKLNNGSAPYHGKLSTLLKWHAQDPVDGFERNRNNVIQKWQGNRNPYIDHPEWVQLIWEQSSSADKQLAS